MLHLFFYPAEERTFNHKTQNELKLIGQIYSPIAKINNELVFISDSSKRTPLRIFFNINAE